jgi:hypothetical protein
VQEFIDLVTHIDNRRILQCGATGESRFNSNPEVANVNGLHILSARGSGRIHRNLESFLNDLEILAEHYQKTLELTLVRQKLKRPQSFIGRQVGWIGLVAKSRADRRRHIAHPLLVALRRQLALRIGIGRTGTQIVEACDVFAHRLEIPRLSPPVELCEPKIWPWRIRG